ncbi:hypothetical protein QBC38DRAFT_549734 [Podospora fimiseda]|uniref:Uncharacterized protein n=1 Tax=Podospora fimiseda TaxID=252190 RepID=A0AAN6YSK7_9PEZI|nr:hypothetical protein QBC38DRAFT_549734 [Podospora fimiseda]
MPPSLATLPFETTVQIAKLVAPDHLLELEEDDRCQLKLPSKSQHPASLARLCCASRRLYDIVHPLLYENVFIYIERNGHLSWPNLWSAPLFARTLLENEWLRPKVRNLTIQTSREYFEPGREILAADFVSAMKTLTSSNLSERDRHLLEITRLPLLQHDSKEAQIHRKSCKNLARGCMHSSWSRTEPPPIGLYPRPLRDLPLRCYPAYYEQEHHVMALILALVPELQTLSLSVSLYVQHQNYLACLLDEFILDGLVQPPPLQKLKTLRLHAADDVQAAYPAAVPHCPNPFICPSLFTLPSLRSVHVRHDLGFQHGHPRTLSLGHISSPITSLTFSGSFKDLEAVTPLLSILEITPSLASLSVAKTRRTRGDPRPIGITQVYPATQPASPGLTLDSLLPSLSGTLTSLQLLGYPPDAMSLISSRHQRRVTALNKLPLVTNLELSLSVLFNPSANWTATDVDLASLLPPNLETLSISDDWREHFQMQYMGDTLNVAERGTRLVSVLLGLREPKEDGGKLKLPTLKQIKIIKAETVMANPGLRESLITGFEGSEVKVVVDFESDKRVDKVLGTLVPVNPGIPPYPNAFRDIPGRPGEVFVLGNPGIIRMANGTVRDFTAFLASFNR